MKIKQLENSFLDGQLILDRNYVFWNECGPGKVLHGEHKDVGSDLITIPICFDKKNKSVLVYLVDSKNKNWYSWIHAD